MIIEKIDMVLSYYANAQAATIEVATQRYKKGFHYFRV